MLIFDQKWANFKGYKVNTKCGIHNLIFIRLRLTYQIYIFLDRMIRSSSDPYIMTLDPDFPQYKVHIF